MKKKNAMMKGCVWVVAGFKDVDPPGTDPNYGGVFWSFKSDDNAEPVADAGEDVHAWLGMDDGHDSDPCSAYVELDGSNSSDDGLPDPPGELSTLWVQTAGPDVTINNATSAVANITVTQLASNNEDGSASPYVFQLTVGDGQFVDSDSMVVTFTSNSCLASHEEDGSDYHEGDINQDCIVDLDDFYEIASNWFQCTNTANEDDCGEL
ncbi:MAG: hypothetical protein JW860_06515 [Sedimentisphaerales bacterium]|nr:hypothetical protein [Sedimentisphaerales bacterium]